MDKTFHAIAVEVDGHKYICGGHIGPEYLVELDSVSMLPEWSTPASGMVDVMDVLDQGVFDLVTEAVSAALSEVVGA